MKVSKTQLLKIISLVKPGISKKEVVEQATHLIFSGTDIATFNDQICILHPFKSDIVFSIKESDFSKIVEKIAEAEFELTLEDDNLRIDSKKTKAKMSTVVGDTALVTHLIEDIRQNMIGKNFWKPLPKDFTEGIYLTSFSASKDLTSGINSCCAIRNDAIYTTDNVRISNYIMDGKMDELLLPAKDASELVKYKVIEYGLSENWAHFRTADGVIFNCKIMKGEYPFDILDGLFVDAEPTLTFPADLKDNVEAVISMAEGDGDTDKSVTLTIEKGRIVVKAEKERGWVTKAVESDYEGEKFEILINPVFLVQVLKHAASFSLLDNKGMFVSDNFYHLLSLPERD